ncbi:hypothetical protein [Thermomonospora cellulosilytica]|uniref:Uncharacterized protein n=1 Tax=Thermomonospora cellulosilytica TaxID=1411118 RepID=A0A7W3MVV9_9ACTN|nr:hypothetical protein [Thermomonospora cellulosilytica]MBA9002838.1 hypothetical protein [Thermomonospora cellulosilytica]
MARPSPDLLAKTSGRALTDIGPGGQGRPWLLIYRSHLADRLYRCHSPRLLFCICRPRSLNGTGALKNASRLAIACAAWIDTRSAWTSWRQWILLVMFVHAFLTIATAVARACTGPVA